MNCKSLRKSRAVLRALGQQHNALLRQLLIPGPFVMGSVVIFKRRCGKKGCLCEKGVPHESIVLSRWVGGKLEVVYTAKEDRPWLLCCRARYQTFRKNKRKLLLLQKQMIQKLDDFAKRNTEKYHRSKKHAGG